MYDIVWQHVHNVMWSPVTLVTPRTIGSSRLSADRVRSDLVVLYPLLALMQPLLVFSMRIKT